MSVRKEFIAKLSTDGSTFTLTIGSVETSGEEGSPVYVEKSTAKQEFGILQSAIEAIAMNAERWADAVKETKPTGALFA